MFKRKQRSSVDDEASKSTDGEGGTDAEVEDAIDDLREPDRGPYDADDVPDNGVQRIDLGSDAVMLVRVDKERLCAGSFDKIRRQLQRVRMSGWASSQTKDSLLKKVGAGS